MKIWKTFTGGFAWPTVLLFVAVLLGELAVLFAVRAGALSVLMGGVFNTLLAYVAFTCMHEAAHGNIGSLRLERLIGSVCAALLFAPYAAFKVLHFKHHTHTNDPVRDPDYWVRGDQTLTLLARALTIVPHYIIDFLFGETSRTKSAKDARGSAVLALVVLYAAAAGLCAAGFSREVLGLWVLPAVLASGLLALLFDWLPHHPHRAQERFKDTRIIVAPGLWLLTLWQNYHLIHHLYPRIPFYKYARCFEAVRAQLIAQGAPIQVVWSASGRTQREVGR